MKHPLDAGENCPSRGARIETATARPPSGAAAASPLTRVADRNSNGIDVDSNDRLSPLTRGRGSKPRGQSAARWARLFGGIAEAYGDANFRRYSVGSIVSWLSFFIQAVAVAWAAWSLTHSTRWLAAVALLDAVPMSVLAPLGGVLADRYDRFRLLMVSYAFATAQAALLTALAFSGALTIEWLAVLAFLHGVIHAFSVPAAFGLLPRFVAPSRLASAISVAAAYTQLGLFVGPALAGWVLLHFGLTVAFATNVFGYGVFFWSAARLRTPPHYKRPAAATQAWTEDFRAGLRAIAAHRGIRALLVLMIFGDALGAAVRQMLPALSDRGLHAGIGGFSTLLASAGIGATLSALWLAQGGSSRSTSTAVIGAFLGYLAATALLAVAPGLFAAAVAMMLRGFCFEICRTATITLLQTSVADNLRGRLMSTQFFLQQGAGALGVAAVGVAAEVWGPSLPILCGTLLAFAVWAFTLRENRRIKAAFSVPVEHG